MTFFRQCLVVASIPFFLGLPCAAATLGPHLELASESASDPGPATGWVPEKSLASAGEMPSDPVQTSAPEASLRPSLGLAIDKSLVRDALSFPADDAWVSTEKLLEPQVYPGQDPTSDTTERVMLAAVVAGTGVRLDTDLAAQQRGQWRARFAAPVVRSGSGAPIRQVPGPSSLAVMIPAVLSLGLLSLTSVRADPGSGSESDKPAFDEDGRQLPFVYSRYAAHMFRWTSPDVRSRGKYEGRPLWGGLARRRS